MKSKGGFSRLFRAALYTRDGLLEALRHEHAFRQELFAVLPLAAVAIGLGVFHKIHWQDAALLCASLLLILVVELLNSAIEACVDYVSTARHPLAKRAKDMGSAAVSLAIGIAVVTWGGVLASWLFG
jgi:diacylglycerol kinase (ATP)